MWTVNHPQLTGTELFELDDRGTDIVMHSWIVANVQGLACAVSSEIVADREWVTRLAAVTIGSEADRTMTIEHDGRGRWSVDGLDRPDLSDCLDVDLGITPSTNTLPIRRLGLNVGEAKDLNAVWLRFPEMSVEVLGQRYERVSDSAYRYSSADFQANLEVDQAGIVLRYGTDLWKTVEA